MKRRTLTLAAATATVAVVGGVTLALAQAEPETQSPSAPAGPPTLYASCQEQLDGAVTALPPGPGDPPNRKNLLKCSEGSWTTFRAEYPSSDRWLSTGAEVSLAGQGVRNAEFMSGRWTATPQAEDTVCRAKYVEVTDPSSKATETHELAGDPGGPLSFDAPDWMLRVTLSGYCLWERQAD